ncbi:MAG: hypothetical protein FWD99_08390 [Oscillospiraceae bacterium]|nr:hypothetical protein [Oscillospiraceae bacterium]
MKIFTLKCFSLVACAVMMLVAFTACQNSPTPDYVEIPNYTDMLDYADISPVENIVEEQSDATIPNSLPEAFRQLNELLAPEDIEWIKNSALNDLISLHFSLGLSIRNNWLRPADSELADVLIDAGIPACLDTISYFIIVAYHHYLNNLEYTVEMHLETRDHIIAPILTPPPLPDPFADFFSFLPPSEAQ